MQILNIVKGGITGIANHVSDNSGKVSRQTQDKFGISNEQQCLNHFNCAYENKILLQGKMYIYENKVCFFSHFNNSNVVGSNKTYVAIEFKDIKEVKKAKRLLFDNTIEIFTSPNNKKYAFTSFIQRNKAYNKINSLLQQNIQEEEWLQEQLSRISQLEHIESQERQQQQQQQIQAQIQEQQSEEEQKKERLKQLRNQIKEQQQNAEYQVLQNMVQKEKELKDKEINLDNQLESSNIAMYNGGGDLQGIYNKSLENSLIKTQSNYLEKINSSEEQNIQSKLLKSQNHEQIQLNENREVYFNDYNALQDEEEEEEEKQQNGLYDQIQQPSNQDVFNNPLELQRSAQHQWMGYETQLKEVFKEREIQGEEILNFHSKKEHKIIWTEIKLQDLDVTEAYLLFFSNQEFIHPDDSTKKKYTNFLEYYMVKFNKEYNIQITEITPQPPEIYSTLYSSNKLQLQDYPLTSTRRISFTHPLEKSMLLPEKINGKVNENLHWISDSHFILERYLNFSGLAMADSFEPRVIYSIKKEGSDVILKCGFYVHFKKKTWFKSKIEKGAADENKKAHIDLERLFLEISDHHKVEREQNKVLLANQLQKSLVKPLEEDQNFLIESNIQKQIYDEIQKEQEEKKQSILKSKNDSNKDIPVEQNNNNGNKEQDNESLNQEQIKQLEAQQTQEQIENINQAIKASNSACFIF